MTDIWDMRRAIRDAKETIENADKVAASIAPILRGRLRRCSPSDVAALKRELRDFNLTTHRWKELGE